MSVWPWSKGSVLLCAWVMLSAIPSAKSLAVACVACFASVCGAGILTCATLAPTFQPCAAALCGPGAFLACAVPCGVGIFAETCHVTEEAALQTEIAPATLSADQAVMAMEHAVRYLASPGTQTTQFPVCRVEWLADAVVPASDGLIHYRSWLDAAVSAATSQDVKVSLAVANVGCGWPMGLQGLQTSSSWALFWEEIAAHFSDNALVNVALNASADTIEVQWPSSPQQVQQATCAAGAGVQKLTYLKVGLESLGRAKPLHFYGWLDSLAPFLLAAKVMVSCQALPCAKASWLSGALYGLWHVQEVSAVPAACVGCYTGCCAVAIVACGCIFVWWSLPAFLARAASNCGATCTAACLIACGAPTP
ncbi:unnamed protein product [Polarella glacialis]|uniref:Uncharacterized protein n=1 Tax=Polarella glacialis TaxID=89957 RepID=A0A813H5E0_POLGL|nr:unnamed protein product [Polarella glacialis]